MNRFFNILKKDVLLLLRDGVGLALLFVMPVFLVVIMTLLQDSSFKTLKTEKLKILVIDNDKKLMGESIIAGLDSSNLFEVIQQQQTGDTITENEAKELVSNGTYKMALIIPPKTTKHIRMVIANEIQKQIPMARGHRLKQNPRSEITVFFDPIVQGSFKNTIKNYLREVIAKVQLQLIFKSYTHAIRSLTGKKNEHLFPLDLVAISEVSSTKLTPQSIPSSTQHNVPAWTVFAIFFMVIPFSGQIIFEKTEGTLYRIRMAPVPYWLTMVGKILVFSFMGILQVLLMVAIGVYILPLFGLPVLSINGFSQIINSVIFTFFIGLAASGYSVLIGTVSDNQHQAAVFGSISIVILAAIGGIWIPTYIMSDTMLTISNLSPLNWSITGYYDIFLRNASISNISHEILKLSLFFIGTVSISSFYENWIQRY